MTQVFETDFDTNQVTGAVVLRDGTPIPLLEIFTRNPDTFDLHLYALPSGRVAMVKSWGIWDGYIGLMSKTEVGAYGATYLAHRDC